MAESSLLSLKSNERDFRDVLLDGGDKLAVGWVWVPKIRIRIESSKRLNGFDDSRLSTNIAIY